MLDFYKSQEVERSKREEPHSGEKQGLSKDIDGGVGILEIFRF